MSPQAAQVELLDLIAWIDANLTGIELPTDERSMVAVGCFDVTIEHQAAIALLNQGELHGSMFALIRVAYESLVRGLWLQRCADEREISLFKSGKVNNTFAQLVTAIENELDLQGSLLSAVKVKVWRAMNGFTHTGFFQVSRRHREGEVRGNYTEPEIAQVLYLAGVFGLIAAGQLAELSGRNDLAQQAVIRMQGYGSETP